MELTLATTEGSTTTSKLVKHLTCILSDFDSSSELTKAVEPFVKQEDEGKFRCKTCQKLFKATSFVEKHIANKHGELVKGLAEVSKVPSPWYLV